MNTMRRTAGWFMYLGAAVLSTAVPGAMGQQEPVSIQHAATETIAVTLGQSRRVEASWPVKRVAVTNPQIADVQVLTPRQVLIQARAPGSTDVLLWSEQEQVRQIRVNVDIDAERIRQDLQTMFPDGRIDIRQTGEVVAVTGQVARASQVEQLHTFLDALGVKYVDMTTLAGVQQVMLQVRIAEVSRTAIRTLGFNAFGTGDDFFGGISVGPFGGTPINPVSIGPPAGALAGRDVPFTFNADVNISPAVTLFGGFPDAVFEFFLQALAENQYLRILAEPNLVALSGEDAHFLVGGEFPIPVVQGGILGAASVTIEYREFGVRLRFRPVVTGDGSIRLKVAPEVSELSDAGAVEIQGFRVPSLVTRRAETTLELKDGQTFAMAGLLQRRSLARASRVPGAGDIPILGVLFRSVRYTEGETELVVLVRASLVEPMNLASMPPAPGMSHVVPNDWELYGLGQLEGEASRTAAAQQVEWVRDLGLDRLKGPGAWQGYQVLPEIDTSGVSPLMRTPAAPSIDDTLE